MADQIWYCQQRFSMMPPQIRDDKCSPVLVSLDLDENMAGIADLYYYRAGIFMQIRGEVQKISFEPAIPPSEHLGEIVPLPGNIDICIRSQDEGYLVLAMGPWYCYPTDRPWYHRPANSDEVLRIKANPPKVSLLQYINLQNIQQFASTTADAESIARRFYTIQEVARLTLAPAGIQLHPIAFPLMPRLPGAQCSGELRELVAKRTGAEDVDVAVEALMMQPDWGVQDMLCIPVGIRIGYGPTAPERGLEQGAMKMWFYFNVRSCHSCLGCFQPAADCPLKTTLSGLISVTVHNPRIYSDPIPQAIAEYIAKRIAR